MNINQDQLQNIVKCLKTHLKANRHKKEVAVTKTIDMIMNTYRIPEDEAKKIVFKILSSMKDSDQAA